MSNQCDGCMRGLPVGENGMHTGPLIRRYIAEETDDTRSPWLARMPWLRDWNADLQVCTRDRYRSEEPSP